MANPKLPDAVKVGNYRFTVHSVSGVEMEKRAASGQFSGHAQTIDVRTDLGDANTRDILLHEILHGILFAYGLGKTLDLEGDGHEERLVAALTPVLLQALRENPAVVRFLLGTSDLRGK